MNSNLDQPDVWVYESRRTRDLLAVLSAILVGATLVAALSFRKRVVEAATLGPTVCIAGFEAIRSLLRFLNDRIEMEGPTLRHVNLLRRVTEIDLRRGGRFGPEKAGALFWTARAGNRAIDIDTQLPGFDALDQRIQAVLAARRKHPAEPDTPCPEVPEKRNLAFLVAGIVLLPPGAYFLTSWFLKIHARLELLAFVGVVQAVSMYVFFRLIVFAPVADRRSDNQPSEKA